VDKKPTRCLFCILYFSSTSCSTCFGQPCAHHQELTTVWFYSLVLVCAVDAGSSTTCYESIHVNTTCQPVLTTFLQPRYIIHTYTDGFIALRATNPSMEALPANRSWQPSFIHGTYQHEAIKSRSLQLLMMGTWLPETCRATSRRDIQNTKVAYIWFFLSTLNYDARSTTHQKDK
jgi:uncharacterized protein YchJ